jgi:phosphoribosylformylglycinamidine cyclo-ligase
MALDEEVEGVPLNAGKLVLSPTRTYAPIIKKILEKYSARTLHGMVHCSGGAQTKVLNFIEKLHVVKDNMFPIPPLFSLIQQQSGTDWKEMYQVFNCGHRMELYVDKSFASDIIRITETFDVEARIIGHVEECDTGKLTIRSEFGTFVY